MQRNEIGPRQDRLQIRLFNAKLQRPLLRQVGIIGQHLHMQADSAIGDDRADVAAANQAKCLAVSSTP